MFDCIGKKIKSFAEGFLWVGGVIYAAAALIMFLIAEDSYDEELYITWGWICLIAGPISTWISSLFMYGFGELIDKVCEIEENTRGTIKKSLAKQKPNPERIEKIEALHSQGLISEEEYQQVISKDNA